jgi:hypothetical protein
VNDFPRALLDVDISHTTSLLVSVIKQRGLVKPRTRDFRLNIWMVSNKEIVSRY